MIGAGMTGAAGQAVGSIGDFVSMFGAMEQRKKYPLYTPFDWSQSVSKAIKANVTNLPQIEQLATEVNAFQQSQREMALESAMPGFKARQAKVGETIDTMLRGELSPDVIESMQRASAAYGVSSGTTGSQFQGFRGLRQIGLTSLQQQQAGLSAYDRWMGTSASVGVAPQFNLASEFVDPWQAATMDEREYQLAHESKLGKWSLGNTLLDVGDFIQKQGSRISSMGSIGGMGGGGGGGGGMGSDEFDYLSGFAWG